MRQFFSTFIRINESKQSQLKALRERATEERTARRASAERPTAKDRKVQRNAMGVQ